MNPLKFDKKGQIKKGYFPPKEKARYIKTIRNGKLVKIVRKHFKGNNIETVRSLIEKAGLKPITFTELMLLINGPYGGANDLEKYSMATFARKLINLNDSFYTDFRKEFGVGNYEVCTAIGDYGGRDVPDIKSLNSPKYIGSAQVSKDEQQYIINISQMREQGSKYTFRLVHPDEVVSIQARTTLEGYYCKSHRTFYPSYTYSPNFATEIIVESVKSNTISKKHYIGFGKEK